MQGVPDGLGAALEQGRHLGGGLEVEVGVGPPLPVGLLQAPVVADGHQGVLEAVSLGDVVVDVVGGHRGHAHLVRQLVEAPDPLGVPLDQVVLELHEDSARPEPLQVPPQEGLGLPQLPLGGQAGELSLGASGEQDQALGVVGDVLGVQPGSPAVGAYVGVGYEAAQVGVAPLGGRQEGKVGAAHQSDLGPGDGLDAQAAGGLGELLGAAQVVVVGEGQCAVAQLRGPGQELRGQGGPLLEGVAAVAVQLCTGGHDRNFTALAFLIPSHMSTNIYIDGFNLYYGALRNRWLNHMPSARFAANGAWLAGQVMAHNLARWTARIGLGERTVITKTLRRRVFALVGRITRSARRLTLHLPRRWPWETQFSRALARLQAIPFPA